MTLPQALDHHFCDILCAWSALEKDLGGDTIVDFNLPQWETEMRFEDREQVLEALNYMLSHPSSQQDRHFYQRVYGLRAYLEDVMNGQTTDFQDYLRATMGFELSYVPDTEIDSLRADLEEKLTAVGVDFDDALNGLAAKTRVIAVDDISAWLDARFENSLSDMDNVLETVPDLPKPQVSIFESNRMTRANITGVGATLFVSFNRTRVSEMDEGRLKVLLKHEILGHGMHFASLLKLMKESDLPSSFGLSCMQGIEAFHAEALAQCMQMHLGDPDDALYQAATALEYYEKQVTNNFLFKKHMSKYDDKALVAYHIEKTPWRNTKFVEDKITHCFGRGSMYRVYSAVYAPGVRLFKHVMDHLDEAGQKAFLQEAYTTLQDPMDLYELALGMGVPALDHFKPCRPAEVEAVERALKSQKQLTPQGPSL